MEIITTILAALSGGFLGYSAGIGFKPKYDQPKNFNIQSFTGIVGIILLIILLFLLF